MSRTRILSPLSHLREVAPLAKAGATELYCGLVPASWEKRFTLIGSVNLRHDKAANLPSLAALRAAIKTAHRHSTPVFVTFNAHFYSKLQLPLVLAQIKKALAAGADSLIIADPALIQLVQKKFPKASISLSTGQPCFNSQALKFFKQLGASRVVLPRHLTAKEIRPLAKSAKSLGLETECFVLNAICPFIDGLCTFQHIVEPTLEMPTQPLACRAEYKVSVSGQGKKDIARAHAKLWNSTVSEDCGLCSLPQLLRAGITSLKIAGRANPLEKKLADLAALKQAIALAKKLSPKKFREQAENLYFSLYHRTCSCTNCYCPDSGRWKQ